MDWPISINIETHDQETAPPYNALSYAWEDPEPEPEYRDVTYPVVVENTSIRISRIVGLWELRGKIWESSGDTKLVEFPLWLDQIFIDQRNVGEKNHQVFRMASIYKNAVSLIVWLFGVHIFHEDVQTVQNSPGVQSGHFVEVDSRVASVFSDP